MTGLKLNNSPLKIPEMKKLVTKGIVFNLFVISIIFIFILPFQDVTPIIPEYSG